MIPLAILSLLFLAVTTVLGQDVPFSLDGAVDGLVFADTPIFFYGSMKTNLLICIVQLLTALVSMPEAQCQSTVGT
jgi:hypothetical protein